MADAEKDRIFAERLGAAVRLKRESIGMSQQELARLSQFHRNWVGRVERGQVNLTVWCLVRLADAMDVPASTLLREAEE